MPLATSDSGPSVKPSRCRSNAWPCSCPSSSKTSAVPAGLLRAGISSVAAVRSSATSTLAWVGVPEAAPRSVSGPRRVVEGGSADGGSSATSRSSSSPRELSASEFTDGLDHSVRRSA